MQILRGEELIKNSTSMKTGNLGKRDKGEYK
jgi:hypothetical protein